MLDDQANPRGLAPEVAKSTEFQNQIEKIIEGYEELELPSLENLHRKIDDMGSRLSALESMLEKLDSN